MPRNNNPIQIYRDRISGQKFPVSIQVTATSVDSYIYTATREVTVKSITAIPSVAGTDGGAVTATIRRCQSTENPTQGDDLIGTTKINLKGTVNTLQTLTLTSTTANLTLAAGDRLSVDFTGTLTAVVCLIQVELIYT